jgi:hypothetical protein
MVPPPSSCGPPSARNGSPSAWAAFRAELDAWGAAGRTATLWWRDDDAVLPTPALERLLALAADHAAPVALAVIPAGAGEGLARLLAQVGGALVLQHGWDHADHAPEGARSTELVDGVPGLALALAEGRRRLASLFGPAALPVMVPPWNRIGPALRAALPGLGFAAVSLFGPPAGPQDPPEINTHADIVDWRAGRRFVGEDRALADLARHLARRRLSAGPAEAATGLLTHHLAHDEDAWAFLDRLLAEVARHPALRWADAAGLLGELREAA